MRGGGERERGPKKGLFEKYVSSRKTSASTEARGYWGAAPLSGSITTDSPPRARVSLEGLSGQLDPISALNKSYSGQPEATSGQPDGKSGQPDAPSGQIKSYSAPPESNSGQPASPSAPPVARSGHLISSSAPPATITDPHFSSSTRFCRPFPAKVPTSLTHNFR